MELRTASCPACGADSARAYDRVPGESFATRGPWTLVSCAACASIYLCPRPAAPVELYDPSYHVHREAGRAVAAGKAVFASLAARALARQLPAGARVLELGCGTGDLLLALARRGCRVRGVELSSAATAVATARGLEVACGDYRASGADAASQVPALDQMGVPWRRCSASTPPR